LRSYSQICDLVLTVTETLVRPSARPHFPIESLLSARLLLAPKIIGNKVFFLSDFSGVLSLYSMDKKGSIPQPLLPGGQALVNPHLMDGHNFYVLPKLGKILVMMDKLGNENYQPILIPVNGGIPEKVLGDGYNAGDVVLYHWEEGMKERKLLYGIPLAERDGKTVSPSGIDWCNFVDDDKGLLFVSSIFHDDGGLTYLGFDNPSKPVEVQIRGLQHSGIGELIGSKKVKGNLFVLFYNIDGTSWLYEGTFIAGNPPSFKITRTICCLGK